MPHVEDQRGIPREDEAQGGGHPPRALGQEEVSHLTKHEVIIDSLIV